MIQWDNITRGSNLVLMRGSEKTVHATFEIYLNFDHFSSPSTTSVPPHIISHLYVSCRLLDPTLVSAAQKPEGVFKDKSKIILLVCSSSPYRLGRGIQSSYHGLKAPHDLRPLPHSLEDLISLTLLFGAHPAAATLASLLFVEQVRNTPTCRASAPAVHPLNPSSLCSNIPLAEKSSLSTCLKLTIQSPLWLLPSHCALFFFLAHLASWQIAYFHIYFMPPCLEYPLTREGTFSLYPEDCLALRRWHIYEVTFEVQN